MKTMKTDNASRNAIIVAIAIVIGVLISFVFSCKANTTNLPENEQSFKQQYWQNNSAMLTEIIHAYAGVLHRVWIDHPSYVEDVLSETDEYINLDQFLDEEMYKEIFSFKTEKDSIYYQINYEQELYNDPGCVNSKATE